MEQSLTETHTYSQINNNDTIVNKNNNCCGRPKKYNTQSDRKEATKKLNHDRYVNNKIKVANQRLTHHLGQIEPDKILFYNYFEKQKDKK